MVLEAAWARAIEDWPPLVELGDQNVILVAMKAAIEKAMSHGITDSDELQSVALACIPSKPNGRH